MPRPTEFEQLLERARDGSPAAFAALVAPHRTRLHAFAHLRLPAALQCEIAAEDIVQETLLSAFKAVGDLECASEAAFRRWLIAIAANVIRGQKRRRFGTQKRAVQREVGSRRRDAQRTSRDDEPLGSATAPLRRLRREERLRRLEQALASLSKEHREVIVLARIEGLPLREVGARMGRTPVAASALLLRALKELRVRFGDTESFALPLRRIELPPRDHHVSEGS